jgi:RNA polymerase sigma factor for flagellar operon FliA
MRSSEPVVADEDALVRDHLPLVGYAVTELASRIPRHVSRDDLVSAGMLGLLQAARSFDPGRGVNFTPFAKLRIRGALLDELRARDWASRSVRSTARTVATAVEQLTAQLQRTPTAWEVAAHMGVDLEAIERISADVERATVVNYESVVMGGDADDLLPSTGHTPEHQVLARERCSYLYDAVEVLPERLRQVVVGSFFEDRPLLDIAHELGVTESRVSQMRSEALLLLRDALNTHLDPDRVTAEVGGNGRIAKRKAGYYAAVASASDFRTRVSAASDPVAERVALAGLGM